MSKLCPQCGAPVAETAAKCEYCGATIAQPVQSAQPVQQPTQVIYTQAPGVNPERANWPIKNKLIAGILAIILGSLGVHKFYLGQTGKGVLYLLFSWTYIPAILGFIEGLMILTSNDENFQIKYRCRIG